MNIEILKILLQQAKIPEYLYNLDTDGRKDERFCLEQINNKWHVYYCERGVNTTSKLFDSEDLACQFILEQLLG